MSRTAPIAVVLVGLLLGLVACGGDDGESPARPASAAAPDPDRYCALTRELDADGEKLFGSLGRDASPKEYEAAERRFIARSQAKLDELRQAAPRQIRADVEKLLAGMQMRAGLKPAVTVTEQQASAAEKRILAYEKRTCTS